jgi:hypothetical protein
MVHGRQILYKVAVVVATVVFNTKVTDYGTRTNAMERVGWRNR